MGSGRIAEGELDRSAGRTNGARHDARSSAAGLPGSTQQQAWRDVIDRGSARATPSWAIQRKADGQAGAALPAPLRRGIEALSGVSMEAVRVHYDSSRPAELGAHAYAQGTEIHVAPRQEEHLGHEAWHVVQQLQGRVRPDAQASGVPLASDPALEAEADAMGSRALQAPVSSHMNERTSHAVAGPSQGAPVQRVKRKTQIFSRVPNTNNFNKNMEIIDSTSASAYVHLSRDAEANEAAVNIQQQPNFFNGLQEAAKRSRVDDEPANQPFNLARYTQANNVHVTLEGRYALVMSRLANGGADLDGIKRGAPVADAYANLNFGSYADHDEYQASEKDIFTYIDQFAEDAEEIVRNREEDFDGQKDELVQTIGDVQTETRNFADTLIQGSALKDLADDDFVHYGGEPWDPLMPADLQ